MKTEIVIHIRLCRLRCIWHVQLLEIELTWDSYIYVLAKLQVIVGRAVGQSLRQTLAGGHRPSISLQLKVEKRAADLEQG